MQPKVWFLYFKVEQDKLIVTALATIPMIFIFFFFYDMAYSPMLVAYTLEILPFNIRAKGFAVLVSFTWGIP